MLGIAVLKITQVNPLHDFEPVERTVTLVMKGKGVTLLDESQLDSIVQYSGAKPLGRFSYGNQIAVPLQESHLNYFWQDGEERVVGVQISTCGKTNPANPLAALIEASGNPQDVSAVYALGEPLLKKQVPQELSEYLPGSGWEVLHHRSSFGQLMSAQRGDGAVFGGSYVHLGLKGVSSESLEALASPDERLGVLNALNTNPHGDGKNYMHEFGPQAFTGVWLSDSGCIAIHVTPECLGPEKLNFVGLHMLALNGDYNVGKVLEFFRPQRVDVASINNRLGLGRENHAHLTQKFQYQ